MSKGFRGPDDAQVVTDRVTSEAISRILEQDAERAERARARKAEGSYGVCEDCGQKIAPERVEALPDATRCVGCQGAWERGERLS